MISQRIRELRLSKGLTLQDIATELGVTRASVSKWEAGHARPEISRLEQLARVLNVSTPYLLGERGSASARSYPVVDLESEFNPQESLDLSTNAVDFPTTREVSEQAFFVRLDNDSVRDFGSGVAPGSLVLVDPSLKPSSGDLVLVRNVRGFCQFVGLSVVAGVNYYESLNSKYTKLTTEDALVPVGVAIEAVHVTDLTKVRYVKKRRN
jgi:transcriptional regulator with XRE-family HTH domain